jgi:hypothetical protein
MIAMKIQKRNEKSDDMANVLPVCAEKLRPFDPVTSLDVSDDAHAAMLFIEARFIALLRSPLYFGLVPP